MSEKKALKRLRRTLLVLGFMILMILPRPAQAGGGRSGARVLVIMAQTTERIEGELIGVRHDAIVVGGMGSREIPTDEIASIRLFRRSWALPGAFLGIFAGGAVGLGIASNRNSSEDEAFEGVFWKLLYVGGGAVVGGLLGGATGGAAGADKTYDLTQMSPDEKKTCLGALRKKARVADYL